MGKLLHDYAAAARFSVEDTKDHPEANGGRF